MKKLIKLDITKTENQGYDDITKPYYFVIDNISFIKETTYGETIVGLNNGKKYWTSTSIDDIILKIENKGDFYELI